MKIVVISSGGGFFFYPIHIISRLDVKPFSDSSDSNSDCNTSDATPLLTGATSRHKSEERRIAVHVHGCHGEPMDVEDATTSSNVNTTTSVEDDCPRLTVPDEVPANCNIDNSDVPSSGGTSNASLTDDDVSAERDCARPDVRRFYRRKKRDVCK